MNNVLRHLVHALNVSKQYPTAMLTLYCDASGRKADQPALVVAGYLSTVEGWDSFGLKWRIALDKYEVPYFHMKEFAHFNGPYRAWRGDEKKRIDFLCELSQIIKDTVLCGVASSVRYEVFDKVNSIYCLDHRFGSPYALLGRDCIFHSGKKAIDLGYGKSLFRYIFEDGDEGKGDLMNLLHRERKVAPLFGPSRPGVIENHPGIIQLQAADFAAYELLKAVKEMEKVSPLWKFRKSLKVLADVRNWWGIFKEQDLVEMCKDYGVKMRKDETQLSI